MPQRHRQHPGRHTTRAVAPVALKLRSAAQFPKQPRPALLAVQQHGCVFATATGIGGEQGLEPDALLAGTRVAKAQCAAGAHRAAGTAAHAQLRVDLDLLAAAIAADGQGRTDLNAGLAAHFFIPAVSAQAGLVTKKFGLFERTHQAAHLQQRHRAAAGPAQIALRQCMLAEGWRGSQVQHQIKAVGLTAGCAVKINRPCYLANLDTGPVRLAGRQVNLVV